MKQVIFFAAVFAAISGFAATLEINADFGTGEKPGFKVVGRNIPAGAMTVSDGKLKIDASMGNLSLIGLKRFKVDNINGMAEFKYTVNGKGRFVPTIYFFGERGKLICRRVGGSTTLNGKESESSCSFRVSPEYANGRKIVTIAPGFYILKGAEITISAGSAKYVEHDKNTTLVPDLPRSKNLAALSRRHTRTSLDLRKQGKRPEILFIGDSITYGWTTAANAKAPGGLDIWNKNFAPLGAVNFGIPADRVENILWRITEGEQLACQPKIIVLMIGTNNMGRSPDISTDIAAGIDNLLKVMKEKVPDVKIILSAVTPRNAQVPIADVNKLLPEVAKANGAVFFDPSDALTGGTGDAKDRKIFRDGLHFSPEGYRRYASVLLPLIQQALKQ